MKNKTIFTLGISKISCRVGGPRWGAIHGITRNINIFVVVCVVLFGFKQKLIAETVPPAFNDGRIITSSAGEDSYAESVLLLPNGKIIVAGRLISLYSSSSGLLIAKYNENGTLDQGFSGGIVTRGAPAPNQNFDIVKTHDGNLLVVGNFSSGGLGLVRFNAEGVFDSSFGENGIAIYNPQSFDNTSSIRASARDLVVQPDGKIIVVGSRDFSYGPTVSGSLILLRYRSDGSLDTEFYSSGIYDASLLGSASGFGALVQPDGKIVAVGSTRTTSRYSSGPASIAIIRINADGSNDLSFGVNGSVYTQLTGYSQGHAQSVTQQSDGKIVVVGSITGSNSDIAILRYTPNGVLDGSFNRNGIVIYDSGSNDYGRSIVVQPDGKIIAAGTAQGDFVLIRLRSDGSLDSDFGTAGVVKTNFVDNQDYLYDMTLQSDGKIVVVGKATGGIAIARYNSDGSLDSTFIGYSSPLSVAYTVTPIGDTGSNISPNSAQTVNRDDTISFTVTPQPGYNITDVAGTCGGSFNGTNYTTNPITADCTIIATATANVPGITLNYNNTARLSPQIVAAGISPSKIDVTDASFDILALVRPGVTTIDQVTFRSSDSGFALGLTSAGILSNGDELYKATFTFPRGSFGNTELTTVWGAGPGQFNIIAYDQAQQRSHTFPDLQFGNYPAQTGATRTQVNLDYTTTVRVSPQVVMGGYTPAKIDHGDDSFDVIVVIRPGALGISTVSLTQNHTPFAMGMTSSGELGNGDLLYKVTYTFPRGSFGDTTLNTIWGDQPGQFNIVATDRGQQSSHRFPDIIFGNFPAMD